MNDQLQPFTRHPGQPPSPPGMIDLSRDISIEMPGPGLKRDYAGLLEYWQMARRHKGALVVFTVLGGLVGFLLTLPAPRIYQTRTSLEIQQLNHDFLDMRNVSPTTTDGYYDSDIQTQVKILQSRQLIDRVRTKIEKEDQRPPTLRPPDRLGVWRQTLRIKPPSEDALWLQALGTAAAGVRVRASGQTRIVEVSCDSTSPELAATFCNTMAQEYIDQNLEARWRSTEYTGDWLSKQLQDLKIKLEKSQEELQSYARQTGLVFTDEKSDSQQTKLADLQKELSAAQAERITKQSKYEMAVASPPGALPDVLDDEHLKTAQASLAELEGKLAQLKVTFTPNHAEVRKAQAQMAPLQASLEAARTNIMSRIRNEYEAARRREGLLASEYAAQARLVSNQAEETAHYNLLKREVDASRMLYENLVQKMKEASIASALRANNIRVVDSALKPSAPYKPDVQRQATMGLLAGMVLGMAFVVFRERADRTLQDPGDVAYFMGVQELGVIPVEDEQAALRSKNGTRGLALNGRVALSFPNGSAPGGLSTTGRLETIAWQRKTSLLAESYRTTLTSILFSNRTGERPRVLVFTSASPKEGKTTTVCNLGISLAEINHSVLVVDADLRRPRLHTVFEVDNTRGLSDLLLEKTPLTPDAFEAACQPTAIPGLFVLPSGGSRHNVTSLLHSSRLPELLALARGKFDTVVVDTPPMVNIADARVVGRNGDALILVVRSGVTTRDAALLAKARFAEDGISILGTILNAWNPKTPGYGYYRYYYAGYQHYYGEQSGRDRDQGEVDVDVAGQPEVRAPRQWTGPPTPRPNPRRRFADGRGSLTRVEPPGWDQSVRGHDPGA